MAVKLNKGVLGQAQCLFAPQAGQSVEGVETTRHFVAATLLDNVSGSLKAWRLQQGQWQPAEAPELPLEGAGVLEFADSLGAAMCCISRPAASFRRSRSIRWICSGRSGV